MLLNQRMLGFGVPEQVFTPEQLMSAYGGHIHMVETDDQLLVVADTCCDEGENT